jgi:hypothetical protein
VSHLETMEKPMAFVPWAERMRVASDEAAGLRADLERPGPLCDFLKPHDVDGALWFTLREVVLVAEATP